jgi:hypothetical protein
MGFSALPEDMEEAILTKLPLVDLARVATTRPSFQAVLRRRLPQERKARCDLGAQCLGSERIARIVALTGSFLEGEALERGLLESPLQGGCSISEDGTLQGPLDAGCFIPQDARLRYVMLAHRFSRRDTLPAGGSLVHVGLKCDHYVNYDPATMEFVNYDVLTLHFTVRTANTSQVYLSIDSRSKSIFIAVVPSSIGDVEGLGVVQALLSGYLGPGLRHMGVFDILILVVSRWEDFSRAGMEAQIGPVLPLLSHCRFIPWWVAKWSRTRSRCNLDRWDVAETRMLRFFWSTV